MNTGKCASYGVGVVEGHRTAVLAGAILLVRIASTAVFLALFIHFFRVACGSGYEAMFYVPLAVLFLLFATLLWAPSIAGGIGGIFARMLYPEDQPRDVKPQYSVAQARYQEGHYLEALREYAKVLETRPHDVRARYERAHILMDKLDNFEGGLREMEGAVEHCTTASQGSVVANRLADLYLERAGRPDDALRILRWLAARFPRSADARLALERAAAIMMRLDAQGRD